MFVLFHRLCLPRVLKGDGFFFFVSSEGERKVIAFKRDSRSGRDTRINILLCASLSPSGEIFHDLAEGSDSNFEHQATLNSREMAV